MARHRGVIGVLASFAVVVFAMLLSAGVPVGNVLPPITTVVAVVAAPLGVVLVSRLLPSTYVSGSMEPLDLRRAEAAHAPRPRRIGGASGGSTPESIAVDFTVTLFEPSEGSTL